MEPFIRHTGLLAVMDRVDVDTDQIIPKQFLKRIERTGYEDALFFDWRYRPDGSDNPDFELNWPRYRGASVLVSGRNFGCGSSREHAPWALHDYGFKAVIAPSFGDIFRNNCYQNGMLPVQLSDEQVREIMERTKAKEGTQVTVDLARHQVRPVEQREPLLGGQRQRRQPRPLQGGGGRHPCAVDRGLALAHQAGRHVRERHEVARGSHRALLGNDGVDTTLQARDEGLDDDRPDPGGSARQRRREQHHDGPRLVLGKRRPHPARVAQHEVALQHGALRGRDDDVLELAHAGGDAVDRLRAAGQPIDERAAGRQPRGGDGTHRDLAVAARDVLHVTKRERAAVQHQRAQIAQPFVSAAIRATSSFSEIVTSLPCSTTRRPCTQTSVTACGDMA